MYNSAPYRFPPASVCDYELARSEQSPERPGEQGVMLLGLVVAIFLILLTLSVAAPRMAHELRREQEVETIHRGNQYVRAIQMYHKKIGSYPGSIEQLEKTNNQRFLRRRYVDPMTGKDDWRLIHLGEAKTTVKGFFGEPLAGIAGSGLGSAAGMASSGGTGTPVGSSPSAFGSPSSGAGSSIGSPLGSSGLGSSLGSGLGSGLGSSNNSPNSANASGSGSQSTSGSNGLTGSGGPFIGVGLVKDGNSITVLNEQTTYATWEFLYDPRIEQMKAKASIFGGGPASTSASSLGSASGSKSNFGGFNSGSSLGTGNQPSSGGFGSGTSSTPAPSTPR
jgi:type II secretory pathway pseudopilin PulG